MTQCTALKGKFEAVISLGMHFPKCGNKKKKKSQSTVNEQRPDRDCALQAGPITWTLGAKGVVLLLRLWLWISKIKQQKKKEKKRKCNKTQNLTKTTTEMYIILLTQQLKFVV